MCCITCSANHFNGPMVQKFETRNILFVSIPFMMTKKNKKKIKIIATAAFSLEEEETSEGKDYKTQKK